MALDKDEKTLRDIVVGYAYEPAFFMNIAVLLTWLPVRFLLLKDLGSLPKTDYLGLSREWQVLITLYLFGQYRYRRSTTLESFLYSFLTPLRLAVLIMAYFAWPRLAGWYLIAFFAFAVLLKRVPYNPRHSMVATLKDAGADEVLTDASQPPQQVVLLYSPASDASRGFLRSFHALARKYSSKTLRFYSMNIDTDPTLARRFNINMTFFTQQVPTVMLLRRGRPRDQLPLLVGAASSGGAGAGGAVAVASGTVGKDKGKAKVLPLTPLGLELGFKLAERSKRDLRDDE